MTRRGSDEILENDVDDTTDQLPGIEGEVVVGEEGFIEDEVPVPADSGKSLVALIAAWLGGILLSFMVAKGWMTPEQSAEFAPAITMSAVGAVAWVTARFLKSRSEVKVAALHAMAARSNARARGPLGASQMGGFAGFSLQGLLGMLATANTMVTFMPLDAKTKAVARKSINAAIAAIKAYQESE